MSEPFLAEVKIVGFTFAPRGWALCDGQILPINQYQSLYSLLGTTYGGDGRTTFGLPELRGRTPVHPGSGISYGQKTGQENHTLLQGEIPTHTHQLRGTNSPGTTPVPNTAYPANSAANMYRDPGSNEVNLLGSTLANAGANQAHNNMMPYIVLNYVIALQGLFPSRN